MATRTELLLYQLGLRLVQAKELHDPHYLEQAVAVVRLSVVRLRDAFAPLCALPNLGPDMGSASGILVEWLNEPRHFDRLGIAELHDREHLAETFKQRFDVMQEEVRTATSRRVPESRLETWYAGELKAVNVAQKRSGRPRWRILDEHLEDFLRSRQSVQPTPPRRRKTKVCTGNQYF